MLTFDIADMEELQGYVRTVQEELENDTFTLSRFLPNNNIDDIEYRVRRDRRRDQDAATVRAWDAESGVASRRVEAEKLVGELPPISRKIRLGEEERLRRRALDRGDYGELIDAVYDDAQNMARAVTARLEMLRGEALADGQLVFNENGVVQTVDFGRDAQATRTAAVTWDNAGAEVVTELSTWRQAYIEMNDGEAPGALLVSERLINNLVFNDQIRALARDTTIDTTHPIVTPETVNRVLSAYSIPPLIPYDVRVRVAGTRTRVIPDHIALFLPPTAVDHGETLLGTTAEALELVGANQLAQDQAPGLTAVVDKTVDPVSTWTIAVAIGLPVLVNPDLGWRLNVLPAS